MSAALAITLAVTAGDYQFVEWTIATLPPDWRVSRDRWSLSGFRTLLSVAALGSLVGSVLLTRRVPTVNA